MVDDEFVSPTDRVGWVALTWSEHEPTATNNITHSMAMEVQHLCDGLFIEALDKKDAHQSLCACVRACTFCKPAVSFNISLQM